MEVGTAKQKKSNTWQGGWRQALLTAGGMILICVFSTKDALSQTKSPPTTNENKSIDEDLTKLMDNAHRSRNDTNARIELLKKQRQKLDKNRNAKPGIDSDPEPTQADPIPPFHRFISELENNLRDSRKGHINELHLLRRRTQDLLVEIDHLGSLNLSKFEPAKPAIDPPMVNDDRPEPQEPDNSTAAGNNLVQENAKQPALPVTKRLTVDPVDEFALANNLVAVGDNETAMSIFVRLAKSSRDASDIEWINYQMGVCSRRTKAYSEAERYFREAANSQVQGIPATLARWWIDRIGERKAIENSLAALENQLSNLRTPDGSDEQNQK